MQFHQVKIFLEFYGTRTINLYKFQGWQKQISKPFEIETDVSLQATETVEMKGRPIQDGKMNKDAIDKDHALTQNIMLVMDHSLMKIDS